MRALYLEPGVTADDDLLDGLAQALGELARFLGACAVVVERAEQPGLAEALRERLA